MISGINKIQDSCTASKTKGIDKPDVPTAPIKSTMLLNPGVPVPYSTSESDAGSSSSSPSSIPNDNGSFSVTFEPSSSAGPSSPSTSQPSTAKSSPSASLPTGNGGYHVTPLSSTGGILSTLSSLILGSTSESVSPPTTSSTSKPDST